MVLDEAPESCLDFPMECPKCQAKSGVPYRATTLRTGGTKVDLRCGDCRHEWVCAIPPSAPLFVPKEDRRKP